MASYKDAFPSKYLKADDLGGRRPVGTIASVTFADVGGGGKVERKLVVRFTDPALKGLVLNLVNADTIAEITGNDDYEHWPGHRVQLFPTKTEFQGKRVPCIRLCAPPDDRDLGNQSVLANPSGDTPLSPAAEAARVTDVGF
jgi:hypothetical protein